MNETLTIDEILSRQFVSGDYADTSPSKEIDCPRCSAKVKHKKKIRLRCKLCRYAKIKNYKHRCKVRECQVFFIPENMERTCPDCVKLRKLAIEEEEAIEKDISLTEAADAIPIPQPSL